MLRHIALFRFRTTATLEEVEAFDVGVRRVVAAIPNVVRHVTGPSLGLQGDGYDYALELDFADESAFFSYKSHPAHATLIDTHVRPMVVETARIQLQLERPDGA